MISIDPRSKLVYASLYILGLQILFGKDKVRYCSTPFKDLNQRDGLDDFDHYFAFFCHDTNRRYVVDFRDKNFLNKTALNWCHVYAKINLNTKRTDIEPLDDSLKNKIIGIGPNFGIRLYSNPQLAILLMVNFLKARLFLSQPVGFRQFLVGYSWMRKRQFFSSYQNSNPKDGYVFHTSIYYQNQAFGENTNALRAAFIRCCKENQNIRFEGGLVSKSVKVNPELKDVLTQDYIANAEWLSKTKNSVMVFNTPAAWGCHGWKIGEYFAMGKAIISTPFYNDTPEGIIHGQNIHIIRNESELAEAVSLLIFDKTYRNILESGARNYFSNHLSPASVVRKIINHA